jgi:hypothetical protein
VTERTATTISSALPRLTLAAALAVSLAACGESTAAKHEKIVRCTGFSTALLSQTSDPTVSAAGQALIAKGVTEQDTVPMGQAATTYEASMDPAKVTSLTDEGKAHALDLIAKKDAPGIADYTKSCVETFKSLGAS